MRGGPRSNKPAALRAVHGSRTRPRHAGEPQVAAVTTNEPPAHLELTEAEQAIWRTYAPHLTGPKVLTVADLEVFAMFCRGVAQIRDIRRQQQAAEYRRVVISVTVDSAGNEKVRGETHPLDAQLRQWFQLVRLTAAELGLSPVSRARVKWQPDDDEHKSPLATLLATRRVK